MTTEMEDIKMKQQKEKNKWPKLVYSILLCESMGIIVGLITAKGVSQWYTTINKPLLIPPNWVFSTVWTTLFLMMGVALWLIWMAKNKEKNKAYGLFTLQLTINLLWAVCFFWIQSPLFAFIDSLFLWVAIAYTLKEFLKIDKNAAYLLIPYILWVSFAIVLGFAVFLLN